MTPEEPGYFPGQSDDRQVEIKPAELEQLVDAGCKIVERHPELKYSGSRFELTLGAIARLLGDDWQGKKIIDLAAGSGEITPEAIEDMLSYAPLLAQAMSHDGAAVLAVDVAMAQRPEYDFTAQRLNLADWKSEDISPAWANSDLACSVSFIGFPTYQAGINNLDFLKLVAKVARFQVHAVVDVQSPELRHLNSENLRRAGLRPIFNFVDHLDDSTVRMNHSIIILERMEL